MGRRFAGHRQPIVASRTHEFQRFHGGDMRDMNGGTRLASEREITADPGAFRVRRNPGEPEAIGHRARVDRTRGSERAVFLVQRNGAVEPGDRVEGRLQQPCIINRNTVVGEEPRTRIRHRRHVDQLAPGKIPRDGGDRDQSRGADLTRLLEHIVRNCGSVVDRRGIRHRGDGREAARRGGAEPARDRLFLRKAGVAQMDMRIDQTRHHPPSGTVDDLRVSQRPGTGRLEGGDPAVDDRQIRDAIGVTRRIDYASTPQHEPAHRGLPAWASGSTIE